MGALQHTFRVFLLVAASLVASHGLGSATSTESCANDFLRDGLSSDGFLQDIDLNRPVERRWLPRPLFEISGLAWHAGSLIAHDDNISTLWKVLVTGGRQLNEIPATAALKGDFEDLAIVAGSAYLLRSNGDLLRVPLALGSSGRPEEIATGLHHRCNFEGLAALAPNDFVLACKTTDTRPTSQIYLYRVQPLRPERAPQALSIDVSAVLTEIGVERLRPSALEWLPAQNRLLVLAGKERVLLEMNLQGHIAAVRRLSWFRHRQAEAMTVDDRGRLVIGDERNGWIATLTVYAPFARKLPDENHAARLCSPA